MPQPREAVHAERRTAAQLHSCLRRALLPHQPPAQGIYCGVAMPQSLRIKGESHEPISFFRPGPVPGRLLPMLPAA